MKNTPFYCLARPGAVLLCALALSCATRAEPEDFVCRGTIVNNTGETIVEAYIAPAYSEMWGENALESPLPAGEERVFSVQTGSRAPYWDVYGLGESGAEYRLEAVSFESGEPAVFTSDDSVSESEETG